MKCWFIKLAAHIAQKKKKKKNVDESVPIRWNPIHQKDTTYKYYLYYRIAIDYATACMKGEKKTRTHSCVSLQSDMTLWASVQMKRVLLLNVCERHVFIKGVHKNQKRRNENCQYQNQKKCASFTKFAYFKCNCKMPITGNPKNMKQIIKSWKTISSSMSVCRFAVAYIYKSKWTHTMSDRRASLISPKKS